MMLSLSSCPLFERVTELITESKGSREIGFFVMEPIKFELDDNNNIKKVIGFDPETKGMENQLTEGIVTARGKRRWWVHWYENRVPLEEFYVGFFKTEPDKARDYLRTYLSEKRKKKDSQDIEAMIFSFIGTNPANPNFSRFYAVCYDLAEDKMSLIERPLPRDQTSIKFKEGIVELITDLCEKLYGEDSK